MLVRSDIDFQRFFWDLLIDWPITPYKIPSKSNFPKFLTPRNVTQSGKKVISIVKNQYIRLIMKVKNSNVITKGTHREKHRLPLVSSLPRRGKTECVRAIRLLSRETKKSEHRPRPTDGRFFPLKWTSRVYSCSFCIFSPLSLLSVTALSLFVCLFV